MAEDKSTQTQFANPDTGEVPIAAPVTWGTPDMYRSASPDALPQAPEPPPPPPPSPATLALAAAGSAAAPPNTPLSQTGYAGQQIGSAEARKDTIEREANNLSRGQEEIMRINREAEAEQRRMLFGNPEELLKAQQSLQAAQALPPNDPNRQLQIVQAQDSIMKNTGAQPLLNKAMEDAKARDESLRADIAKAHAYSQSKAAEVDPERYWNSKSTEGKILAGIGMVLSGMGGGMTGSNRNLALEQLNKAIDNDIAAQQANIKTHIDGNWKSIADKHQLNQEAFNRDLHRQVWENNFRTSALETVKLKLGSAAAMTQSETVKNNAVNMIQTLTDEQAKIRNDQWKLAVQAQQAELNRMRALSKEADTNVQKLMEKDGVSYEDAVDAVYNRPYFRGLIGAGMAPPEAAYKVKLGVEYQRELEKQKAQAKLLGAEPGSDKYKAILGAVQNDPKYAPLFKQTGVVVPKAKSEEGTKGVALIYDEAGNVVGQRQFPNEKEAEQFRKAQEARIGLKNTVGELQKYQTPGMIAQINTSLIQGGDVTPEEMRDAQGNIIQKSGTEVKGTRQTRAAVQDQYHAFVMKAVGEMYKAQTGGVEPKNLEIIQQMAAPYLPSGSWEDQATTRTKMLQLQHDLEATMATKAMTAPPDTTPGRTGGAATGTSAPAGNVGKDGKPYGLPVIK